MGWSRDGTGHLNQQLCVHANDLWTRSLSTVMLGLRSNVLKCGYSPADYVYGTSIRLPGKFTLPQEKEIDSDKFITEFKNYINLIKPIPVIHNDKRQVFVHRELKDSSQVFLRVGPAHRSLQRPYSGPHKVIQHTSDRVYEIEINGKNKRVSIENLKPSFFLRDEQPTNSNRNGKLKTKENEKKNIAKQKDSENKLPVKDKKDDRKKEVGIKKHNVKNNQVIPVSSPSETNDANLSSAKHAT